MAQLDGGANPADLDKAQGSTNDKNAQNGGGNDIQKQFDELKAQFETLSKESRGKDAKISELLKEKDLKDLSSKTEKEQLEAYKLKVSEFERREAFRTAFKEVNLNPDEFIDIIDEKDPKTQAHKFAELLQARADDSAKKTLEDFKKKELEKTGKPPKTKDTHKQSINGTINDNILAALGKK